MMGKKTFLLLLIVAMQSLQAQQTKQHLVRFQFMTQAGLLEGEKGAAFQLHLLSGIRWQQWAIGAGTGLDYYGMRSIPLFLDIRRNLASKPAVPFIYLNAGTHFIWPNEEQQSDWQAVRNRPGWLLEAGVGYQLPIGQHVLYFTGGYSQKSFRQEITSEICPAGRPCMESTSRFDYVFRRISIRTGFRF